MIVRASQAPAQRPPSTKAAAPYARVQMLLREAYLCTPPGPHSYPAAKAFMSEAARLWRHLASGERIELWYMAVMRVHTFGAHKDTQPILDFIAVHAAAHMDGLIRCYQQRHDPKVGAFVQIAGNVLQWPEFPNNVRQFAALCVRGQPPPEVVHALAIMPQAPLAPTVVLTPPNYAQSLFAYRMRVAHAHAHARRNGPRAEVHPPNLAVALRPDDQDSQPRDGRETVRGRQPRTPAPACAKAPRRA